MVGNKSVLLAPPVTTDPALSTIQLQCGVPALPRAVGTSVLSSFSPVVLRVTSVQLALIFPATLLAFCILAVRATRIFAKSIK